MAVSAAPPRSGPCCAMSARAKARRPGLHSYGTHNWEESGDRRLTLHLMGHAEITTTAIYAHVTPTKQRERLAKY
jgi:integrase